MGEHETDYVMLGGWAVLSSWAVGFLAAMAQSNVVVLAAALVASAGAAIIAPELWKRRRTAAPGAAALVLPWALNAPAGSEPLVKAMIVIVLVVLVVAWVIAAYPASRSRRGKHS